MERTVINLYFSPTGNTKKSVEAMAKAIGGSLEMQDLTTEEKPADRQFEQDAFVIFGAPVYGGRIPAVAKERFSHFKGRNTPCIVVVTYGNRAYDDALAELADLAQKQGFQVKGAAALVGRHTYGEIQTDRPNEDDFKADQNFAIQVAAKPDHSPTFSIPGNIPDGEGGKGGAFRPLTSDQCVACGLCVRQCPVHAIGEDCKTISDSCLACFRCIRDCPVGAKHMDTEAYQTFAAEFTEKLKKRRENEYYL